MTQTPEQVLDRLDFTVLRRLDGLLQGDYRTLFRGGGLDFTDLRAYQPHDDTRHIDWNVTARMNTPFVRQYVEDRELTAWFLLDRSASMAFGGDPSKAQMLTDTVVCLARLLTNGGNRVGAISWNNQVQTIIEPHGGRTQVLRLAKEMQASPVSTAPTQPARRRWARRARPKRRGGQTRLGDLATSAHATIRRRSLVFLVSDFVSEPGWERPVAQLGQRHEVIALRIVDPAEAELPNVGVMVMEDAETGEQIYVDSSDQGFRDRFAQATARRNEMITSCSRRARMDLHTISTSDDLVRAIVEIAQIRKQRLR